MTNEEFKNEVKTANPIENVIGEYIKLQKNGRLHKGLCPFHSEKTPSFTVYEDTQSYYCFGCGVGGEVFNFIMRAENLDFLESLKFLAQRAGIAFPSDKNRGSGVSKTKIYEINRLAANFYYKNLISGDTKTGLNYLIERGVKPQTVKSYGLGFSPNSWDALYKYLKMSGYTDAELVAAGVCRYGKPRQDGSSSVFDFFRNRVMFPILDLRGNVIAFGGRSLDADANPPKYLNTGDTPAFSKRDNLFSMNFAKNAAAEMKTDTLILAEGYMDVAALWQAGFKNSVATLGTAITPSQARLMSRYCKQVVIAYDSDGAGQKATEKAVNVLSEVGLSAKTLKIGTAAEPAKDPDEYIKKYGALKFKILLEHAGDAVSFELERQKEGLELDTNHGRSELLKRQIAVLSNLRHDAQIAVYAADVSAMCGVLHSTIIEMTQKAKRSRYYKEKKENWNKEVHGVTQTQSRAAQGIDSNTSQAEKNIISFILRNPEKKFWVDSIPKNYFNDSFSDGNAEYFGYNNSNAPKLFDYFVSPLYAKLYHLLLSQDGDFANLSAFTEFLSLDEMDKLTAIAVNSAQIPQTEQSLFDCINYLISYSNKKNKNFTEMSDDELRNLCN